jgi:hypothetical protein
MAALAAVALFAVEREKAILSAFAILIGAGIIVSAVAWVLLRREVRRGRAQPVKADAGPNAERDAETESNVDAGSDLDAEPGQVQPQA